MSKTATLSMETLINNWNVEFPDYQLSVEDLKKPLSLMGALFQVCDRLGIDRDAVLMPPPEKNAENEHCIYYWDLIPVINMTRVINHLVSVMQHPVGVSVNHFLQPTALTSHSILLLPFNLMAFNEERLRDIAPYEEGLFQIADTVKELEDRKNKLFEMLNRQAEEKGKRALKMEQLDEEIRQMEEELKAEEQARDQENQELEAIIQENNITEVLLDQKRATKEGLLAERERKRALRVYDADEVRANVVQASQSVQEAEEKLNSLQAIIAQKENSLKILQVIKPNLDAANNLLQDITKSKDYELGDLESDSREGELDVHKTELAELRAQESELASLREEFHRKRQETQARRHHEKTMAESAVREEEEKDRKRREFIARAEQRTQQIQQHTAKYEEQKAQGYHAINEIVDNYHKAIKTWEEALIKQLVGLKTDIERRQRSAEA